MCSSDLDWRRQTAINIDGVFLSVKHSLPLMRKHGGGSIIMMSSLAGLRGAATLSGYSATKGAVRLFAKSIAMECAQVGDGIRVNSVHPGIIDTPIWGKIPTGPSGAGQNAPIDPEERARFATPLGRAVTGDAESYQYLVESIRKFPRPNAFAEMISAAGFARVKWQSLSGGIVALHSGWRL